jgi:hypothetical protein
MIAKKICTVLKLSHRTIPLPRMPLDSQLLRETKDIVTKTGGSFNIASVPVRTSVDKKLRRMGVEKIITGGGFDEVNGGTSGIEIYSKDSFIESRIRHSHVVFPR